MPRVDQLIQQMPAKDRQSIDVTRARELEGQLGDEPIVTLARSGFPFGTMVVTDRRLLVLLQDGGVQVIPYADISAMDVIEGKKTMGGFGAKRGPILAVQYRAGGRDEISVGVEGTWGLPVARAIVAQHQSFAIRNT